MAKAKTNGSQKLSLRRLLHSIGPGLVTGAADDDPSGVATYSQTGAQFGYRQLWTALYTLPLLIAVQEACARIGAVTGKGIATVIRDYYSKPLALATAFLIVIANVINVGADLGAMAAAASLIIPVGAAVMTVVFALSILLVILTSYKTYSNVLKWMSLTMLAYVITVFMVSQPWPTIALATFLPHIELSFSFLFIITGVIGTTISPYLFFWEADQEVEEVRDKHLLRETKRSRITPRYVRTVQLDNALGMIMSNVTTWCIIVTTATVLHNHGIKTINTTADAAKALEPLVRSFPHAGYLSKLIFSLGIIGLGLLSIPVLSGSASYAVAGALNWKASLNYKVKRARGFYTVMVLATLIGLVINFIGINPFQALIIASVVNGIIAVPLLFLIALIAENRRIMGKYRSGPLSRIFLWFTCGALTASAGALIYSFLKK